MGRQTVPCADFGENTARSSCCIVQHLYAKLAEVEATTNRQLEANGDFQTSASNPGADDAREGR
jgi:hypothetical protein